MFAQPLDVCAVGALHLTCSDEAESECVEAFQRGFVQYMLPPLKFARQSAFRLASLGGRYEWGAVRLAESHFVPARADDRPKLMVVKLNAHVAFEHVRGADRSSASAEGGNGKPFRFGLWKRYGVDSHSCGALHALLAGSREPYVEELHAAFESEGIDRTATLLDESRVNPAYRPLYAGIVSARLQARMVMLDIQDYTPATATHFLVVPCATINRHERDTEIVCGSYMVDRRDGDTGGGGESEATYFGLGDDPATYEVEFRHGMAHVNDDQLGAERQARDHRALVGQMWSARSGGKDLPINNDRLQRIKRDVAENKHHQHHHAKALLRASLPILAEIAPVPAAILMFSHGVVGIHHAFRIHRLARQMAGSHEAKHILEEVHHKIDHLDPDEAEALIELLVNEYSD